MRASRIVRRFAVTLAAGLALCFLPTVSATASALSARYAKLPLSFEVNRGQADGEVRFLARGPGYGLFLTQTQAVLSLHSTGQAQVVRMRPARANQHALLTGLDPQPHTSSYFFGSDPSRWQRDVPNYARVKYAGVYPGIDLVYYGNQRQLEYDFVVAPGANPRLIELAFDGVKKLSLDAQGNLLLETPQGAIVQRKPVIYQDVAGARKAVQGRYSLRAANRVGFKVARYDRSLPLVIDPVLAYSTYLGGAGNDVGRGIAVDAAGNAYVAGSTTSLNFPGTNASPIDPSQNGSTDVFVAKINAAGNALVYSTYLGGSGADLAYAIAVDSGGNAYITGDTDSNIMPASTPFPTVAPFQSLYKGGGDAFVTKLNAAGNAIVYSTYLGGGGNERGYGIAVDSSGNAYVTGHTNSDNTSSGGAPGAFPTIGPLQGDNAAPGSFDAFVTKFNAAGNALVYSTYLGGTASEFSTEGGGIAVDGAGNAYVAGATASANFPGTGTSAIQAMYGGGVIDGFVAKLNAAGSALVYSTYLGGSGYDSVFGIAVDAAGNAHVTGYTDSTNFPTVAALQPARGGTFGNDAFVAKLNAAGSALLYSTYLGGSGGDIGYAIALDTAGNAYVSGWTDSFTFPIAAPIQAMAAGGSDAFVVKLNATGSSLLYGSYLGGGNGAEHGHGIAVDSGGNAYVTGSTSSTNFPTVGALQGTSGGSGTDAFVTKIRFSTLAPATDLNGDSRSDLLYRNFSTGQVYRMLMNGFTISGADLAYTEPNTAWKIVADADFNGDGVTDLLWRNDATGQVFFMPFNASGYPSGLGFVTTEPNTAWKIVHAPDLDGDGKADILWWNSTTGQVYAMIMNGSTIGTQGFVYTEPNTAWKIVATGDFAGSGKRNQLLWRNSTTGQVYLMTVTVAGNAISQTGQMIYQEANTAWKILAAADFNGDGKSDILYRNDVTGQVYTMLMNGGSVASAALVYTEPNLAWKIVAQGDYNGDGKSDILWRNDATGQVYMMLMNGLSLSGAGLVYSEPNTAWKILGPWEYGLASGIQP